ncbi:MAG TPA: hypothetical protein PLF99_06795, partial [Tenuifilaceae bacterium]|nr:hypothetical protein [Tenuifilaceae bacterium]
HGRKHIVITGPQNENFIIIEKGLNEGDEVYLNIPESAEKFTLVGEELIPEIRERAKEKKRLEEEAKKPKEKPVAKMPGMRKGPE